MTDASHSQFALMGQTRFGPFFWTQFFGAANDNVFKFAFTVMVTYQVQVSWLPPSLAGLVIGALFILPFLLFSATSAQLAEKLSPHTLMQWVKNLEIAIMALAAFGFLTHQVVVLLLCIFLMGLHSTLFGPVKYAYLPQVLQERELTGGNGMVEMGTFVAILLGNVLGGVLVALPEVGHHSVALACLLIAIAGRWCSAHIPQLAPHTPHLQVQWNPFTETWRNLQLARSDRTVFLTLLGISWLWFYGAVFLSQFPSFAKEVLHGDANVASLLLVLFSLGIGVGSLLCEVLSRGRIEIGLSPIGALGMSLFAIDLFFASHQLPAHQQLELIAFMPFISTPEHWRLMADLFLLSLFAGLFSVPMYALIQHRTARAECARIIAANNIINALFMIASSLIAGAMLSNGLTIPDVMLWTGMANAVFCAWLFVKEPQYLVSCRTWLNGLLRT